MDKKSTRRLFKPMSNFAWDVLTAMASPTALIALACIQKHPGIALQDIAKKTKITAPCLTIVLRRHERLIQLDHQPVRGRPLHCTLSPYTQHILSLPEFA